MSQQWKLVPVEPTKEMLSASWRDAGVRSPATWKAMLDAAPQPPALGDKADGFDLAIKVRDALDRTACPDAWMRVAVEASRPIFDQLIIEASRLQAEVERWKNLHSAMQLQRDHHREERGKLKTRTAELEALLRLANLAVEDMADVHSDNEDASSERNCRDLAAKIDAALNKTKGQKA